LWIDRKNRHLVPNHLDMIVVVVGVGVAVGVGVVGGTLYVGTLRV
jgi:hypothetical protein